MTMIMLVGVIDLELSFFAAIKTVLSRSNDLKLMRSGVRLRV